MENLIQELKQDLIVPQVNNYLFFPKSTFGLSNLTHVYPLLKKIEVELIGVSKESPKNYTILNRYTVTETGEKTNTVLNQQEITNNNALLQSLNLERADYEKLYNETNQQLNELEDPESQEALALIEELQNIQLQLNDVMLQINAWVEVLPQYEYINKYDDVIAYFKNDGSLTDEGLVWAKTITFMGAPIGDYIV